MNIINECLEELNSTNSSNAKKEILSKYKNEELVKQFFKYTYEPRYSYYIRNLKFFDNNLFRHYTSFNQNTFKELDPIINREITGDGAKKHINDLNNVLDPDDSIILKLILGRDAKCGVSVSTINKIWPNLITDPSYMRCSLPKSSNMKSWDWSKGILAQEKMDGMFCKIVIEKNQVYAFTRAGNSIPLDNPSTNEIARAFKCFLECEPLTSPLNVGIYEGNQWHGELIVVDSENNILPREIGNGVLNSIIQGEYDGDYEVKFVAWDLIVFEGTDLKYSDRLEDLDNSIKKANSEYFIKCKTHTVYSYDEAINLYKEYLTNGSEGIVVKHPNMIWKDGTSKDCVKIKLEAEIDLKIVGFNKGNGKNSELFGSLICESSDGILSVNVSGFKDKDRKEIFDNFEFYQNEVITVKANALMKNPKEESYSLFLPRFVEIRQDKTVADDLNTIKNIFNNL